jgi:hypothetical protein
MELNTRETAILIWGCIMISALIIFPKTREPLGSLLRAFSQRRVMQVLVILSIYVGLMIWFLHAVGVWGPDQIKNTVIWIFSVALVAIFRSNKISDETKYFLQLITDNFKVLAFVQFLVNLYTYPLWVEFIIFPFLTVLYLLIAMGSSDSKTKSAVKFLERSLAFFVLGFFGFALCMTISDFWTYATIQTWRDLYFPIILTTLFLPFIYMLYVFMSYESAFVNLGIFIKDKKLRRTSKWMAFFAFGIDVKLMLRWSRHIALHSPATNDELKDSIREVKQAKRMEEQRLPVPIEMGWAPGLAKEFLIDHDLATRDYYRSYGDEWCASSNMREIGDDIIPNNIAYYIEGNEGAATKLKIKLNINSVSSAQKAESIFKEVCESLINIAIGSSDIIIGYDEIDEDIGIYRIGLNRNTWVNGISGGYDRVLRISVSTTATENLCGS